MARISKSVKEYCKSKFNSSDIDLCANSRSAGTSGYKKFSKIQFQSYSSKLLSLPFTEFLSVA